MTRSTNSLPLLIAASLVALVAACATNDDTAADSAAMSTPATATTDSGALADSMTAPGALVDPNTATREQLLAVPGMNAATVDAIIAGRPHATMLTVDKALPATFTDAQRDSVYERMFKKLDLNTATKEEIMLIPGVGDRMHHEFEEYRPYTNIAQFRREMAKYVKDTTIARYEKYVELR